MECQNTIASNCDTKFVSHFWRLFDLSLNFSSATYPWTDGHTNVVRRTLGNLI